MLVLSRRKDETIVIDRRITIKVVHIQDGKVRLGIVAPVDMSVNRGEVQAQIDARREAEAEGA